MAAMPNIRVTLELEQERNNLVYANLTFLNVGSETAHLWRRIALLDGRLNAERFIVTQDGKVLAYTGRTAKVGAPQPGDFVPLAPGKSVSARVLLNQGYAIASRGQLKAQYEGFNPSIGSDALTRLISNVASLDLQ